MSKDIRGSYMWMGMDEWLNDGIGVWKDE